jgi:SAM-dependent methyltransferase
MTKTDFVELTEIAGEPVSAEQVERIARRYYWASGYCAGKDLLEVACGTGQGVGYIAGAARSLVAGDYSESILAIARRHYGDRFKFLQFDAQQMPFSDGSFDAVILFEALYYIPDPNRFFNECRRVLRPGGSLLISNANKDLYDFIRSPHSYVYHGVVELERDLSEHGFRCEFFGDTPIVAVSTLQRVLRPIKALASRMGIIPKSMTAKRLLKRLVFGRMIPMPAEISEGTAPKLAPTRLPNGQKDSAHKVILCRAVLEA